MICFFWYVFYINTIVLVRTSLYLGWCKISPYLLSFFTMIYEHYGVQVDNGSFLDFESMTKRTDETHRQFYERLLHHVKQHLAKAKPGDASTAEKLSVTLTRITPCHPPGGNPKKVINPLLMKNLTLFEMEWV